MKLKKPIGLFNVLKDACKSAESDDLSVVQKFNEYFGHHSDYVAHKSHPENFSVLHYAAKVKYNGKMILSKSRENLSKETLECLQKSEDSFVVDLFSSIPGTNGNFSK